MKSSLADSIYIKYRQWHIGQVMLHWLIDSSRVLAAYLCRLHKRKNLAAIVCGLRSCVLRFASYVDGA